MKRAIYAALATVLLLGACGEPNTQTAQAGATDATKTQAAEEDHNYSLKDGEAYGYTAAITPDEKNAGQAAGEVTFFRFAGAKDGSYYLVNEKKNGLASLACDKPCKFVKVESLSDSSDEKTIEFNSSTLLGEAMEDAQAGRLMPSPTAIAELAGKVGLSQPAK